MRETWEDVSPLQAGAVVGLLALVAWARIASADGWVRILDDANLVFHEAGHPVFGIFGATLGLYGGTLGQLTMPAMNAVHFHRKREPVGFALGLAWFFENFLNIARYMADARAQRLPLVGGGDHDWTTIFANWHVIQYDIQIAGAVSVIGWMGYAACAGWILFRRFRREVL